jgi:hypothetical protein
LNDGRIQNPSNPFGIVPISKFAQRGFGFVHHSMAILYHEVPNPNVTIRNFFIAEPHPHPHPHHPPHPRPRSCLESRRRGYGGTPHSDEKANRNFLVAVRRGFSARGEGDRTSRCMRQLRWIMLAAFSTRHLVRCCRPLTSFWIARAALFFLAIERWCQPFHTAWIFAACARASAAPSTSAPRNARLSV